MWNFQLFHHLQFTVSKSTLDYLSKVQMYEKSMDTLYYDIRLYPSAVCKTCCEPNIL